MDRRHALLVRGLTSIGSAVLIAAALWAAEFPPKAWWQETFRRLSAFDAGQPGNPIAINPSRRGGVTKSAAAYELTPPYSIAGTQSSLAPAPQALLLISTAPGRNEGEGTARIGVRRENPQTYVAGAILVNGARIAEIHRDHVVLKRDKERLELFVVGSSREGKYGANDARDLAMTAVPAAAHASPAPARDHLSEVIRAMAHYENAQLAGLLVRPGRRSTTFTQLGLRSGDVVVAIDEVPIADMQSAIDMLRSLLDGTVVHVRVRRDGMFTNLTLDGSIMVEGR